MALELYNVYRLFTIANKTRIEMLKVMSKAGTSDRSLCLDVFLVQLDFSVPSI